MICENCGKEHDGSYGSGRFCSVKCARSFSTKNSRKEINTKISKSLKDKYKNSKTKKIKLCKICNKKLKYNNKTGYCIDCLRKSPELSEYRSNKAKYVSSFVKDENRKYWQPRNQLSYAEKFFIEVLTNNNIEYIHDYTVIVDNKHRYYLDFYICCNNSKIDLEIDGKQHDYEERKYQDNLRDEFLIDKGFIVYRIKWNEINSNNGKLIMKSKIDNFLNFYNNL